MSLYSFGEVFPQKLSILKTLSSISSCVCVCVHFPLFPVLSIINFVNQIRVVDPSNGATKNPHQINDIEKRWRKGKNFVKSKPSLTLFNRSIAISTSIWIVSRIPLNLNYFQLSIIKLCCLSSAFVPFNGYLLFFGIFPENWKKFVKQRTKQAEACLFVKADKTLAF